MMFSSLRPVSPGTRWQPSAGLHNRTIRTIAIVEQMQRTGAPPVNGRRAGPVWFKIVSQLSGNGAYSVVTGKPKTNAPFNPDSDGAEFEFFTYDLPEGETFDAYFVNQAEENKTPHWLDVGGKYFAFIAHIGSASDGKFVLIGHTFDTQECEEE